MNLLVMGLQWGDEGKGKAIDYLAEGYDVVVRYQGGHNAGHTIYYNQQKAVLHLLPSGVFTPGTLSVIGNGVVVNPMQLVAEIDSIKELGVEVNNLVVSHRAPLILPFHQNLDIVFEQSRYLKIGTTRRGIGPAYEDLIGRRALFVGDLLNPENFRKKLVILNEYYNKLVKAYGGSETDVDTYIEDYLQAGEYLRPYVTDTTRTLNDHFRARKTILFEGAQGILLDISHGTYPFVTSSNPSVGGVFSGTGLPVKAVGKITGISKAYTTRVGEGPFPSEIFGASADMLRKKGSEFGATTGRPRRVGWLDLVALRYAVMINGVDSLFLTKLDILDTFSEISVVNAYNLDGKEIHHFDPTVEVLNKVKPEIKKLPGWQKDITQIKDYGDLPQQARDYIKFIEEAVEVKVEYVSVGGNREQTIRKSV